MQRLEPLKTIEIKSMSDFYLMTMIKMLNMDLFFPKLTIPTLFR